MNLGTIYIIGYLQYLKYIIRHKYYVMIECFKYGLYWRGLIHDISKFLPSEFFPYVKYFYINERFEKYKIEYNKIEDDKKFNYAWLFHIKRNPHHWQHWVLLEDEGNIIPLDMPYKYIIEMICDWIGASKTQGYGNNIKEWYKKNKDKMKLSIKTRSLVEYIVDTME